MYGTGETKTKETALNTQFCMSNRDLLNFLSSEILNRINNEWYEADRIDVWGFDTWGKTCNCDNCKKIGNSTDRTLYFISYIRDYLDKAKINGTLDHDVSLIMCSYEGTDTLLPPEKDIPENFIKGKDYITFYPILRCYKHNISDKSCSENSKYMRCLKGWGNIPIMLGEYYNVSKFEDLPFLFTKTMQKDFLTYRKNGVAGMSYMHIPMMEWGVRNLTQSLFAALCNNISLNIDKFKECYFCDRYGIYSEDAKKAYTLCEKASEYASSWRSWGENCILSVLNAWDGSKPIKELYQDEHFNGNVVETGEKCIENYKTAAGIMRGCLGRRNAEVAEKINIAEYCIVNPVQQQNTARDFITAHIEEDIRLLMYGHDVMNLTVLFIKYYNALLKNEDGDAVWYEIDTVSEDMAERYMPMTYINSEKTIELTCKDMFERSQLHTLYYKCLKYRLYTNLKVKE